MWRWTAVLALVACRIPTEGLGDDAMGDDGNALGDAVASAPDVDADVDANLGAGRVGSAGYAAGAPQSSNHVLHYALVLSSACQGQAAAVTAGVAFADLQSALDAAVGGDEVVVCPGVHPGPFELRGTATQPVTIRSYSRNAADTALSGGGSEQVLALKASTPVILQDLEIRDGVSRNGGGVEASSTVLELHRVWFRNNEATYSGGGLASRAPVLRVLGCRFEHNYADYEGGGLAVTTSRGTGSVVVEGTAFVDNEAGYEGGGISANAAVMRVVSSEFVSNYADYEGGGLQHASWAPFALVVEDSLFDRNEAAYEGGGLSLGSWAFGDVRLERTELVANVSPRGAGVAFHSWDVGVVDIVDGVATDHASAAYDFNHTVSPGQTAPMLGVVTLTGGAVARNGVGVQTDATWSATTSGVTFTGNGTDVR